MFRNKPFCEVKALVCMVESDISKSGMIDNFSGGSEQEKIRLLFMEDLMELEV